MMYIAVAPAVHIANVLHTAISGFPWHFVCDSRRDFLYLYTLFFNFSYTSAKLGFNFTVNFLWF